MAEKQKYWSYTYNRLDFWRCFTINGHKRHMTHSLENLYFHSWLCELWALYKHPTTVSAICKEMLAWRYCGRDHHEVCSILAWFNTVFLVSACNFQHLDHWREDDFSLLGLEGWRGRDYIRSKFLTKWAAVCPEQESNGYLLCTFEGIGDGCIGQFLQSFLDVDVDALWFIQA